MLMMRKSVVLVVALVVVLGWGSGASAVTIDFEDPLPDGLIVNSPFPTGYYQGTAVHPASRIENAYSDYGILMTSVALVQLSGISGAHAPSGFNGIAPIGAAGVDYGAPMTFSFVSPLDLSVMATTDYFSLTTDVWGESNNVVTMTAYDISGQLIGMTTFSETASGAHVIELPGLSGIHKVVVDSTLINQNSGGIAMDLLTFNEVLPIPEPNTALLLGFGLLGLGVKRRSRRAALH
jgi:hypothetical protein